jgi:16S rRNA (guanine966-N2)-methyltransferase
MRIVAGKFGGRQLVAPKSRATRPMTDKVRAALFDALGSVEGWTILDAYAGSGALGFEALSRGAERVEALEFDPAAIQAIIQNQRNLDLGFEFFPHKTTVESWLSRKGTETRFDLVVADPPYDKLKIDVLEKLGGLLKPGGLLVLSHGTRTPLGNIEGLELQKTKNYGDSSLSFYAV